MQPRCSSTTHDPCPDPRTIITEQSETGTDSVAIKDMTEVIGRHCLYSRKIEMMWTGFLGQSLGTHTTSN